MFLQKKTESLNPPFHLKNGLIGDSVHHPCGFCLFILFGCCCSAHFFSFLNPPEANCELVKWLKFPPEAQRNEKGEKKTRLKKLQSVDAKAYFHTNSHS